MDNGKAARIALSFDDCRGDNYRVVREILEPMSIQATFNITTGYVSGELDQSNLPCKNEPLSIEEVQYIYANPIFEIAGHGFAHKNSLVDWTHGINDLKQWLGEEWCSGGIGVASPHCGITQNGIEQITKELDNLKINYIRIGLKNQKQLIQRVISKAARDTGNKFLFILPIRSTLRQAVCKKTMHSVPVLHQHTMKQMRYLIEYVMEQRDDCVLQIHSVLKRDEPFYDDMFSIDFDMFEKFIKWLNDLRNKNKIKIDRCIDLYNQSGGDR